MYYEVQAILKKFPDLEPVFDKEAAVKYITWDKNQWISYDDADTFKLKLKWANEMGFGGSMIWAVDTDDDKFTAMSGLMGHQVAHINTDKIEALEMTSSNLIETIKLENEQGCYVYKSDGCREDGHFACPHGESLVAVDRQGCVSDAVDRGAIGEADLLTFVCVVGFRRQQQGHAGLLSPGLDELVHLARHARRRWRLG